MFTVYTVTLQIGKNRARFYSDSVLFLFSYRIFCRLRKRAAKMATLPGFMIPHSMRYITFKWMPSVYVIVALK